MTNVIAVSIATAGLVFSLSVELLIEELIFGAILRLFFGRRPWIGLRTRLQAKSNTTEGPRTIAVPLEGFEYAEPAVNSQWSAASNSK